MTRPVRRPDALVLVASRALGQQLDRVRRTGWAGPVVVVGDRAEAEEMAAALRAAQPGGGAPARSPEGSDAAAVVPSHDPPAGRPQLMLDPDRRLAVSGAGRVHLTPLEFGVLRSLLLQPGRVCTFAELAQRVWGTSYRGDTSQAHSVVKRLRRKLDGIDSPIQVQAVHGAGFRALVRVAPEGEGHHDRVTGE